MVDLLCVRLERVINLVDEHYFALTLLFNNTTLHNVLGKFTKNNCQRFFIIFL